MSKTCKTCARPLPLGAFGVNNANADKLHTHCKECRNAGAATWRRQHPEQNMQIKARYRAAHADVVRQYNAAYYAKDPAREMRRVVAWQAGNPEKVKAYAATWKARNVEKVRAATAAYCAARSPLAVARAKAWRLSNPSAYRRHMVIANAKRKASVLHATPKWETELTAFAMSEAAHLAALRETYVGGRWHVDHVVPLQGGLVRGLHVWNNLQVLPAAVNLRKGNKFKDICE